MNILKNCHGFLAALVTMFVPLAFTSCDEESSDVNNIVSNYMDAYVNSDSVVSKLTLDNGKSYLIDHQSIKAAAADTTIRCVAAYSVNDDSMYVKVYDIAAVYAEKARTAEELRDSIYHDPTNLVGIWMVRNYINIAVAHITSGKPHTYGFCIDSVKADTTFVSLLHKRPENDREAYSHRTYLSLPTEGMSKLKFTIRTYSGNESFTFNVDSIR